MRLKSVFELPRQRRRLLVRAVVALTASSAAVALLPFRSAIAFGSVGVKRRRQAEPANYVWAIEVAARRLNWRTMCIQKGLAVQRLLRKDGVDAVLHYGARRHPESGKLQAHVWVTVADEVIIGGSEAPEFAEIATYPHR